MVRFLLFTFILFFLLSLQCQINCDSIFITHYFDPPKFDKSAKNDFKSLNEFIKANLNYPQKAKEDKIEGSVFVQFWIDTNGYTCEHKVIQSVRQDLDNEAMRVVKLIKYDVPAKNDNGKPIGLCNILPINFSLKEEKCKDSQKPNK